MTANEVAAWDMLVQHCFSRSALAETGELAAYLSLGISSDLEERWRAAFVTTLLNEVNPECLEIILAIACEYSDEALMTRILSTLDDVISEESMSGADLISSIGKCLIALESGTFDESFKTTLTTEFLELADRAEYHLNTYDTDGRWREMLAKLTDRYRG